MALNVKATVEGRKVLCPICSSDVFLTKEFLVTSTWMQALDFEFFGREGIMLICKKCSHIQQFANKGAVSVEE